MAIGRRAGTSRRVKVRYDAANGRMLFISADSLSESRPGRPSTGPADLPDEAPGDLPADAVVEMLVSGDASPDEVLEQMVQALQMRMQLVKASRRLHTSVDELLATVGSLALSTPAGVELPGQALSPDVEDALREAGSLAVPLPPVADRASTATALRQRALLADAMTVKQTADLLGVSDSRIRQRLTARSLWAVADSDGWKFPQLQFTSDPGTGKAQVLRGLNQVLPVLPGDVHPVVVARFLSTPRPELAVDGEPVSPVEWLSTGGAVEPVIELAEQLHTLP